MDVKKLFVGQLVDSFAHGMGRIVECHNYGNDIVSIGVKYSYSKRDGLIWYNETDIIRLSDIGTLKFYNENETEYISFN